jgi:hypothetical protein
MRTLCTVFVGDHSEPTLQRLESNIIVAGRRCHWAILSYRNQSGEFMPLKTRLERKDFRIPVLIDTQVTSAHGYTSKIAQVERFLFPYMEKQEASRVAGLNAGPPATLEDRYERTWLMDSDLDLTNFDFGLFSDALRGMSRSPKWKSAPSVAQPTIFESTQKIQVLNHLTWGGPAIPNITIFDADTFYNMENKSEFYSSNAWDRIISESRKHLAAHLGTRDAHKVVLLAAETAFVEVQAPNFDTKFLRRFLRDVRLRMPDSESYQMDRHDWIWCGAARAYKHARDMDGPACLVVMVSQNSMHAIGRYPALFSVGHCLLTHGCFLRQATPMHHLDLRVIDKTLPESRKANSKFLHNMCASFPEWCVVPRSLLPAKAGDQEDPVFETWRQKLSGMVFSLVVATKNRFMEIKVNATAQQRLISSAARNRSGNATTVMDPFNELDRDVTEDEHRIVSLQESAKHTNSQISTTTKQLIATARGSAGTSSTVEGTVEGVAEGMLSSLSSMWHTVVSWG